MPASLMIVVHQAAARAAASAPAAPAPPAHPGVPSRSQLADEIRQATQDAIEGSRAATEAANATGRTVHIIRDGQTIDIAPLPGQATGGTLAPAGGWDDGRIPRGATDIAYAFFLMCAVIAIGWPIARALGRRIDRRTDAPPALPPAAADQLVRIEQAVEAMAIEVERISESQRFVAKLQQGAAAERV